MEMQNNMGGDKRKRKPLQKATLVYSVKTGQHTCGTYSREPRQMEPAVWRARA